MKNLLFAFLLSLLIAIPVNAIDYTLTVNQTNPVFGQDVNFTATIPQEATRQSHNPQFHDNPYTQVNCYQNGVQVFSESAIVLTKVKDPVGYKITTTFINLSANGGNGLLWTSGAATCQAVEVYFTQNKDGSVQANTLGYTTFNVGD